MTILFLSGEDVARCAIGTAEVLAAVAAAFRDKADGMARTLPGVAVAAGPGTFHAKGGIVGRYAALKWFGYHPANRDGERPAYTPLVLLNEVGTGRPLAVIDGGWITAVRTAAISTVAAMHLAAPPVRRVGFVACGAQAYAHLDALGAVFDLESVVAFSRRRSTAEAFAAHASGLGIGAAAVDDPREAVCDADVIVTSVPRRTAGGGFLDVGWTRPGAFIAMPDLGHGWRRATLASLDLVVTDDLDQGGGASGFNCDRPVTLDLPSLLSNAAVGRREPAERIGFLFSGTGLADAAVAALVHERAQTLGLGRRQPM